MNTKFRDTERQIAKCKNELLELKNDMRVVKNKFVKDEIQSRIDFMKRRIERKEFELWKMERENKDEF